MSLGNVPAPRKGLTYEQLEIYYHAKKLKLNEHFKTTLELLTPDGIDNFIAYMLADENGVSIKVAKYAAKDKVDLIEYYEYGYCSILKATNQVLDRLDVENRIFTKITPKERVEKQMINRTALREAVINAIVHNDYSRNAVPTVEIFADRVTITSYGGLPEGLSRESFFECCSMPRNRELMRVFRDVGLVEQLGSGMSRILSSYDKSVFKFAGDFLIVTFPYEEGLDMAIDENDGVNGVNNGVNGVNNGVNGVNNGVNGVNDGVNNGVNESDVDIASEIIFIIKNNSQTTINDISRITGASRRTIERVMASLKARGMVKRVGSPRSGHWEICSTCKPN